MKNSKALTGILFISGLMLIGAGAGTLLSPIDFTARNGIDLYGQVSLMNDIRGAGGLMLGSGLIIMAGAFFKSLTFTSTVVSAVIYLTFSLGRVLSMLVDGMPADGLVKATAVEAVAGLLAVFALVKFREKN